MENETGKRLIEIYTDPSHPASFSHPEKIYRYLKDNRLAKNVTLHSVKRELSQLSAYGRFKRHIKKYPKMTTRSDDADERWQIDLMNVTSFGHSMNDGYRYLLLAIDVLTRKLVVVPLITRTGKEVASATELIFMTSGRIPQTISSDSGQEFAGKEFKSLCKKYGIKQYFTLSTSDSHASVVERANLTLRWKIAKFLHHNQTKRYIDHLEELIGSYNNAVHATLDVSPNQAFDNPAYRQIAIFNTKRKLNGEAGTSKPKQKFFAGDKVRIPVPVRSNLRVFRKGHEPTFTNETYDIEKIFLNDKNRAVAKVATDKNVKKTFYPNEMSAYYE